MVVHLERYNGMWIIMVMLKPLVEFWVTLDYVIIYDVYGYGHLIMDCYTFV